MVSCERSKRPREYVERPSAPTCRGAGVEIWPPGRWRRESKAKPAIEVINRLGGSKTGPSGVCRPPQPPTPNRGKSFYEGKKPKATFKNPAHTSDHRTLAWGGAVRHRKTRKARASASACEPYREIIELGLSRGSQCHGQSGRIWFSDYGFQSGYQKAFGASLTSCRGSPGTTSAGG